MTQERYWYQDGWNIFLLVFVVLPIIVVFALGSYANWREDAKPYVSPKITGRIEQPLFDTPRLVLIIWHQHPGNLRNGHLVVTVDSEFVRLPNGDKSLIHSFETWEPNRDHAVTLTFPLNGFDRQKELPIQTRLTTKHTQPFVNKDAWLGDNWKSNLESAQ